MRVGLRNLRLPLLAFAVVVVVIIALALSGLDLEEPGIECRGTTAIHHKYDHGRSEYVAVPNDPACDGR